MDKKVKILFIEDEPDHMMLVKAWLDRIGYEVIGAEDGLAGVEKAKSEKPAIILLDIMMPQMDGFEVCALLKADPQTKNIPILVVTAVGYKDIAERCQRCGADDWIHKPFDEEELEVKIKRLTGV